MKILILLFTLLFSAPADAQVSSDPPAGLFSGQQARNIICAQQEARVLYYYFIPEPGEAADDLSSCKRFYMSYAPGYKKYFQMKREQGSKTEYLPRPAWLDAEVPRMRNSVAWNDPVEKALSEAQLWSKAVAQLYEFMDITIRTFPKDPYKGQNETPVMLIQEYSDLALRFSMSLDRLYRARIEVVNPSTGKKETRRLLDSMDGRARTMMGTFEIILADMNKVLEALAGADMRAQKKYIDAINAIANNTHNVFLTVRANPRQTLKEEINPQTHRTMGLIFTIVLLLFVFVTVFLYFSGKDTNFEVLSQKYVHQIRNLTADFNRQFLQIKVQYLVIIPIALFMLLGIMTMSLIGFVVFTAAGVYIGLKLPAFVLNFLKKQRGKKVDIQLMDALILLSNSLKSGMAIEQGFELVSTDLTKPISEEFGLAVKNYQLGSSFESALEGLQERVSSRLLAYMIRSVVLQRQVGGNLTKIFGRIVENIREEAKLEEKIKVLTASQRVQALVVGLMPWVLFGLMFLMETEKMSRFYSSVLGIILLIGCIIWVGIGITVVNKMGQIKV